jgi:protein required for attachment to host cells
MPSDQLTPEWSSQKINTSFTRKKKDQAMPQKHWILVANASHARVFERASFTAPLVELTDWLHPESRMPARDTERTPLGHSEAGRAGLAPRSDLKHLHRSEFATTLAKYFHEAVLNHRVNALAFFVSNPLMGELLSHLDASVQHTLVAKHVLDLTSLSVTELDKRLRREFRL